MYLWSNYLCQGSKAQNFIQSKINQFVFLREDCILLVYVDDIIAISRSVNVMDNLVVELKKEYALGDEGSLTKYLGVDMKENEDETLELRQLNKF